MTKKINIDWNNIDWDEEGPSIKSDGAVSIGDSNRRKTKDKKWVAWRTEQRKIKFSETPEGKKKIQEQAALKVGDKKFGEAISNGWKNLSEEQLSQIKHNQSEGRKKWCAENKDKVKQSALKRASCPEWKKKNKETLKKLLSPEIREKADESRKKWIVTPYGEFKGIVEYEKECNGNFTNQQKLMPHLYYIKDNGPGEATYEEVVYTPYGYAPTAKSSQRHPGFRTRDIYNRANVKGYRAWTGWFAVMSAKDPNNYFIKSEPKREWLLEKDVDKDD